MDKNWKQMTHFLTSLGESGFAYDLKAHVEINLPRIIKDSIGSEFTFLNPDEIAGYSACALAVKDK